MLSLPCQNWNYNAYCKYLFENKNMSKMHQEGNSHFFVLYFYIYLQDAEQWEDRSCVGKTRIYANQLHIYISENFLLVIDEFCILILHKQTFTADILCFQILFLAIIRNIMFWNSFNKNIYAFIIILESIFVVHEFRTIVLFIHYLNFVLVYPVTLLKLFWIQNEIERINR